MSQTNSGEGWKQFIITWEPRLEQVRRLPMSSYTANSARLMVDYMNLNVFSKTTKKGKI